MNIKLKRKIALILACVLTLSLAGCKSTGEDLSTSVQYVTEEEIVYVDDQGSSTDNSSTVSDNSSDDKTQSNPNEAVDTPDFTPNKYEKYRGTTVKFAVTSDPMQSEKAYVINNFEKEYGIKIEPVIMTSGDQVTELTSLIASGKSPDVVRSSGDFPLSLSYLQSLDAAELDYSNPIWEQGMFKLTTFGGSPYLCTTEGNVYTESDIVVYRKDILKQAGCKTPEEYADEGKWNIDAFFEIARQCKLNCSFVNYDSAFHMTGNSVFKIENGKFVNGVGDSVSRALAKISEAKKQGIVTLNATAGIVSGKVAITTHHSYALRKTGAFEKNPEVWEKLGFYYLPSFDGTDANLKTGLLRGWGLIKDAPNPVAAGIFLEYYLDPNNCDVNNMYISAEAETFFFKATDIDYNCWNPYFTYGNKNEEIAGIKFNDDIYTNINLDQAQLAQKLNTMNTKIDTACDNINYYIEQAIYID